LFVLQLSRKGGEREERRRRRRMREEMRKEREKRRRMSGDWWERGRREREKERKKGEGEREEDFAHNLDARTISLARLHQLRVCRHVKLPDPGPGFECIQEIVPLDG
jgi:hypothetical protein